MLLLLLLSLPMLEHASLLFVKKIVFVKYHRIILSSLYIAFIVFGMVIFLRSWT